MAETGIRVQVIRERVPIPATRYRTTRAFVATIPADALGTPLTVDITAHFNGATRDWDIMTIGVIRNDGDPAITTEILRQVPVAATLRRALQVDAGIVVDDDGTDVHHVLRSEAGELRARRANGPTPANLMHVAELYEIAKVLHEPPLPLIAESFGLPDRTASHWVKLARARGQLAAGDG